MWTPARARIKCGGWIFILLKWILNIKTTANIVLQTARKTKVLVLFRSCCLIARKLNWYFLFCVYFSTLHHDICCCINTEASISIHISARSTALLKAVFHVPLLYFEHLPLQRSLHGPARNLKVVSSSLGPGRNCRSECTALCPPSIPGRELPLSKKAPKPQLLPGSRSINGSTVPTASGVFTPGCVHFRRDKCRAQIPCMGYHTWSYVTSLSLYSKQLNRDQVSNIVF